MADETKALEVTEVKNIKFPEWYVSISFAKSSSQNFPQAVEIARMAPQYFENAVEGKITYQAVYSEKPNAYLSFIRIYELIKDWKSCFVIINGQLVDRKIIGGLNYCYGDRCRSGNPDFCSGASYMTENPFGCHRIQINACNHPWWFFGRFDSRGVWHVDKEAMLKRIIEYSEPYRLCPAFSWDKAVDGLKNLPDRISPGKKTDWIRQGNCLLPKNNRNAVTHTINIEIAAEAESGLKKKSSCLGCGCGALITLTVLTTSVIILLALF